MECASAAAPSLLRAERSVAPAECRPAAPGKDVGRQAFIAATLFALGMTSFVAVEGLRTVRGGAFGAIPSPQAAPPAVAAAEPWTAAAVPPSDSGRPDTAEEAGERGAEPADGLVPFAPGGSAAAEPFSAAAVPGAKAAPGAAPAAAAAAVLEAPAVALPRPWDDELVRAPAPEPRRESVPAPREIRPSLPRRTLKLISFTGFTTQSRKANGFQLVKFSPDEVWTTGYRPCPCARGAAAPNEPQADGRADAEAGPFAAPSP